MDFGVLIVLFLMNLAVLGNISRQLLYRLPRSALIILLLLYALFGWLMGVYNLAWFFWLLTAIGTMGVSAVLSFELGVIGSRALVLAGVIALVGIFLEATLGRLATALALALALAGAWFWAVGGARYRMEGLGFDRIQTFWSLTLVSWEGLYFGWIVDTFLIPSWGDWVIKLITS